MFEFAFVGVANAAGLAATIDAPAQTGTSPNGAGQFSTVASAVTAIGGVGALTYDWELVSGSGQIVPSSDTSATVTWMTAAADILLEAVYRCKVMDASGAFVYSGDVALTIVVGTP